MATRRQFLTGALALTGAGFVTPGALVHPTADPLQTALGSVRLESWLCLGGTTSLAGVTGYIAYRRMWHRRDTDGLTTTHSPGASAGMMDTQRPDMER